MAEQAYASVKDLAERYRVTTRQIWRMAERGLIPAPIKIGGSTRWRMEEVIAAEAKLK